MVVKHRSFVQSSCLQGPFVEPVELVCLVRHCARHTSSLARSLVILSDLNLLHALCEDEDTHQV